jgi:hypothetical protein
LQYSRLRKQFDYRYQKFLFKEEEKKSGEVQKVPPMYFNPENKENLIEDDDYSYDIDYRL